MDNVLEDQKILTVGKQESLIREVQKYPHNSALKLVTV